MRLLAIGDIHGCLTAFETLLAHLQPGQEDTIVALGDYVDRGPDSKRVLDRLLQLAGETRLIPLLGNHDSMFRDILNSEFGNLQGWLAVGGLQTLESYGNLDNVPPAHRQFLSETCRLWFEPAGEEVFFVHGSAHPSLPLERTPEDWLLWRRVHDGAHPHVSGRTMVCGHTAQRSGLPLILPHAICIDTWAVGEGWLTCYDVHAGAFLQTNQAREFRRLTLAELRDA